MDSIFSTLPILAIINLVPKRAARSQAVIGGNGAKATSLFRAKRTGAVQAQHQKFSEVRVESSHSLRLHDFNNGRMKVDLGARP